jgi:dTDP-glucose pyrophosphorylase
MTRLSLESLLVPPDASIKEAIVRLNETGKKVVYVIDPNRKLVGSVTDGDIRRAIINGRDFSTPLRQVMCPTPHSVRNGDKDNRQRAKELMLTLSIEQIPILDREGRVLETINWTDLFQEKTGEGRTSLSFSTPVVIMAGGRGTRLDPLTRILPKPLIPLGDKPIVEHIMDNFQGCGFSRFILTLNYKRELIKAFFRDNGKERQVDFLEEPEYLGSAGSLFFLKGNISETFYVTNCDIILEAEFNKILEWHREEKAMMTLIASHRELNIPYGLIECDGSGFKSLNEKPVFDLVINSGAYLCEPSILDLFESQEFLDMNGLIARVAKKGKVSVYPIYKGWSDAGQVEEYQETLRKLGGSRET